MEYRGDIAERETALLGSSFACGLLTGVLDTAPNIVNAELLLRDRGIELVEDKRPVRGAFASLIRAELSTREGACAVAGTLFGENMPRLVQLGENQLEAFLDGNLIIFQHKDVPGIIGVVGTICGRHGVNIAQMAVGRAAPGGAAIGVLNLDSTPSPETIAEIFAPRGDPQSTERPLACRGRSSGLAPGTQELICCFDVRTHWGNFCLLHRGMRSNLIRSMRAIISVSGSRTSETARPLGGASRWYVFGQRFRTLRPIRDKSLLFSNPDARPNGTR